MRLGQKGYTLVSVLVAMSLAAGLFAASASLLATLAARHTQLLLRVQGIDQIDAALMLIHTELRRSGYAATNNTGQIKASSYEQFILALASSHNPENMPNRCITFAYDRNSNGQVDSSPSESFGFRLHNNSIEMRMSGRGCQQTGWQDITEPNVVTITDMQFDVVKDPSFALPMVKVSLVAHVNGTSHQLSRERFIALENHREVL